MASNHGNLYNEILALLLGHYGAIHAEVNGTGVGVGVGNGSRIGSGWNRRDGKRKTGEGRVRCKREREVGEGTEKIPLLVGDVQKYGAFYKEGGEDTNLGWIVQHKKWPKCRTSVRDKGGCPRTTWTWASSRKPRSRMEYSPEYWKATILVLHMCRANTMEKWRCSTGLPLS